MNHLDPRLKELERFDRWLLSRTRTELRQIALLAALTVNFPNAWVLSHCPVAPDVAVTTVMIFTDNAAPGERLTDFNAAAHLALLDGHMQP
jgi:hypothetical protein